ncbi:hypothetical protein [Labedaea rhizosphaerae]|uniref:Uncharacterized protein n=1 Tax=Labedaea rhizosphaerae TaxID=598644 RepID=A0A4R6SHY2_LABRH|nr:hypothetical protein [Labedaea rhizosphaerae]TDQ01237.1 hypothetical protein EV186_1021105 [Labedaea rhizosphaerae]
MRPERALQQRFTETAERFRTGQVGAVINNTLTVTTSGGASLTVPRLATWTPAVGDVVVLALTPGGWIALGKIA